MPTRMTPKMAPLSSGFTKKNGQQCFADHGRAEADSDQKYDHTREVGLAARHRAIDLALLRQAAEKIRLRNLYLALDRDRVYAIQVTAFALIAQRPNLDARALDTSFDQHVANGDGAIKRQTSSFTGIFFGVSGIGHQLNAQ